MCLYSRHIALRVSVCVSTADALHCGCLCVSLQPTHFTACVCVCVCVCCTLCTRAPFVSLQCTWLYVFLCDAGLSTEQNCLRVSTTPASWLSSCLQCMRHGVFVSLQHMHRQCLPVNNTCVVSVLVRVSTTHVPSVSSCLQHMLHQCLRVSTTHAPSVSSCLFNAHAICGCRCARPLSQVVVPLRPGWLYCR